MSSVFAVEIQIAFLLRTDPFHFALPKEWRLLEEVRNRRIAEFAANMSPTAARDGEILEALA